MKLKWIILLIVFLSIFIVTGVPAETRIRCASTTSMQNSGLFDYILPIFEKKTGIKVDVVAVGTGAAIELGKRGDADFVFVHAKGQELKAVEQGYFVNRYEVMFNDFVIIGPSDDPVKIRGIKSVTVAFRKIAESEFPFVSRGDNSGTHMKELSIWKKINIDPEREKWYLDVGQGMAKTQRIANEKRAYTLTDRGTWLATKDKDKLEMIIVLESDPLLFNQYGIMAVNPEKHKHVKYNETMEFIDWIISEEGQQVIASYTNQRGNKLFIPNAK